MSIALSMITKDSVERVSEKILLRVLDSTLQIPYNTVILIDDSTTERTREFVRKFAERYGKEIIISKSRNYGYPKPTRATARQTAIDIFLKELNHEWILFLDDDVVLSNDWWVKVKPYMDINNIGLITGAVVVLDPFLLRYLRVRNTDPIKRFIILTLGRGYTGDTLIKRQALESSQKIYGKIPPYLHEYEDAWLFHTIRCTGWRYIIIKALSTHYGLHRLGILNIRNPIITYKLGFNTDPYIPNVLRNYETIMGSLKFLMKYVVIFLNNVIKYRRLYGNYEMDKLLRMETRIIGNYILWLILRFVDSKSIRENSCSLLKKL